MIDERAVPGSFTCEEDALERAVLKHAREAFGSQQEIDRQWRELEYRERPNLVRAIDEYDRLVEIFEGLGVGIHLLPSDPRTGLDSLYPRDAAVASPRGMILCRMGKPGRRGEPAALGELFERLGIPICGSIGGGATLEGGDVVWLAERVLAVGRGYRTNDEGVRQLRALLGDSIDEMIVAQLPHYRGPDDVFHLMSILSPIDYDLALVYSPLLPVPLRQRLLARGFELVEVPEAEFTSMACNALAVAPRRCLMMAGNPKTRVRLEAAGAEVIEFDGEEICRKGAGGPTCLTLPVRRSAG